MKRMGKVVRDRPFEEKRKKEKLYIVFLNFYVDGA
jgi:hypothetical protein